MVHASHAWLIIIDSYILFSILMWAFILFFFAPSPSVLAPIYCINSIKERIVYNIFRLGWFWKCVYGQKPLKGLIYSLIDCLSWMFSWNHLFIVFPSYSVFIFIKYKKWIDLWALFVWLKRINYSNQLNLDTKNDFFFPSNILINYFPNKVSGCSYSAKIL